MQNQDSQKCVSEKKPLVVLWRQLDSAMVETAKWAMFGFAVGLLTEYATGSDFVDQVKILLSNFGIVDLE
ncbi:Light-harvesting complex-like protein OHP2, chloroplastic [Glycine soja]|uniref:Light-harvesting complex-like protein OHP2, chloroplastic n=1 Tax=Glycine soja TaxID=3848 RepID=A0A445F6C9_GLYSO|nr:Light-harvesting complex-like protein OHP2, chloroplastic [Glycine soja]